MTKYLLESKLDDLKKWNLLFLRAQEKVANTCPECSEKENEYKILPIEKIQSVCCKHTRNKGCNLCDLSGENCIFVKNTQSKEEWERKTGDPNQEYENWSMEYDKKEKKANLLTGWGLGLFIGSFVYLIVAAIFTEPTIIGSLIFWLLLLGGVVLWIKGVITNPSSSSVSNFAEKGNENSDGDVFGINGIVKDAKKELRYKVLGGWSDPERATRDEIKKQNESLKQKERKGKFVKYD